MDADHPFLSTTEGLQLQLVQHHNIISRLHDSHGFQKEAHHITLALSLRPVKRTSWLFVRHIRSRSTSPTRTKQLPGVSRVSLSSPCPNSRYIQEGATMQLHTTPSPPEITSRVRQRSRLIPVLFREEIPRPMECRIFPAHQPRPEAPRIGVISKCEVHSGFVPQRTSTT